MPGKCPQCGAQTYSARTTMKTVIVEIQNIPCTVCQECGQEELSYQTQKKIDKLLDRAGKGKLRSSVVVM